MKEKKTEEKKEGQSNNGQRSYSDEALMKALNVVLDPDHEKLLSLTDIFSAREAWHYALQITREAAIDPNRDAQKAPLSRIFRESLLRLKRSKNARTLLLTFGVANQQLSPEEPGLGEEGEL